jgi:hypothetical protein
MVDSPDLAARGSCWAALGITRRLANATSIGFDTARRPASAHHIPRIHDLVESTI